LLRARTLARLASALQPARDFLRPIGIAREAIAMARRVGDRAGLLAVIHAGMSAMMDFVSGSERLVLNLEAERLASALGDRPRALRARARLVMDHAEMGALDQLAHCLDGYEALARELRASRFLWLLPLMRAMSANLQGRFDGCEAALAEAAAGARQAGDPSAEVVMQFHRLGLYRTREWHDQLLALEPMLAAQMPAIPSSEVWWPIVRASLLCRVGRRAEATAAFASYDRDLAVRVGERSTLGFLAEVAAGTGDLALCQGLYPLLAPLAGQLLCFGMIGLFCEGPYDRQLGLVAAALGNHDAAAGHFEAGIVRCRQLGLRPHLSRLLFEYAEARAAAGDPARAATLAGEARALASALDQTGLLAQLDAFAALPTPALPPSPPARAPVFELRREGEYWTLVAGREVLRLKDTRGLRILHQLVTHPDREFHVSDLAAAGEGVQDAGDAGELVDTEARAAYRERLSALDETIREAESFGDPTRASRAREEREFIAAELSRAVGLGGRERRAASSAERARVAVQKRIKDALRKIEEGAPDLGRHLVMCIRTGSFCVYHPSGRHG
jgi:hypothetical protein